MNEYDDPYKILAAIIVGRFRAADVARTLGDDAFLKSQIIREVREQDMRGCFLDCIITSILEEKKRMEYMGHLDRLADYYFSKLDLNRLRREIKTLLNECKIDVEYYSATGNIRSASA